MNSQTVHTVGNTVHDDISDSNEYNLQNKYLILNSAQMLGVLYVLIPR